LGNRRIERHANGTDVPVGGVGATHALALQALEGRGVVPLGVWAAHASPLHALAWRGVVPLGGHRFERNAGGTGVTMSW
jgi:hypothetical protein